MKQIAYLIVLFLCASIASSFEVTYQEYYQQHWQRWKSFYGKTYGSETEEDERFSVWNDNLRLIQRHNSKGQSYSLAMNQFGDLTAEEFRFLVSGSLFPSSNEKEHHKLSFLPSSATLPPFVDWRSKGYVTQVKNQGELGRSWAFSVTGSLEGQHFKKTGKLVSLSEQNLEDCSGCINLITAIDCGFEYVKNNGGIDTENGYPHPCNKSCCFDKDKVGATCTGYVDITPRSELALQSAVATVGPISVAVDASHQSFQFYSSGVYDEPSCSSSQLDHAVLVVGYGAYEGKDYWLVKNSWGTHWGMEGYIMMSRNKNNQCGIATSASYPLV